MKRDLWMRLRPVLERLLEADEDEHDAILEQACGGDEAFRRSVVETWRAERADDGFLDPPDLVASTPSVGDRLGAWVLERPIGAGGMGTVWLAARADGAFEMRAAVKLLRALSPEQQQRLQAERRVLARLDHPNIARLLDGGTTDKGVPYLVMEHVDGQPIDRHGAGLSLHERLQVFLAVCDAVDHAHRNLIVHRDLKPANVLVDEAGRPRLLDFGISKILGTDGTDPTLTGSSALTPQYASPEQVRGQPITTAADVYALGVMLYELVAGRRPYELDGAHLADVVHTVCERRPDPPGVDADLDLIVMTAIAKDAGARYGSAGALAEDLRRWLRREPILARPPSLAYQLRTFARRHALLVAAAAAVVLVSVAAAVVSTRSAARADALFARLLDRSLDATFGFALQIHNLPGAAPVSAEMIAQAVDELERLAAEAQGDAEILRRLALAHIRLGDVRGHPAHPNLGDTDGARRSYERALTIAEPLHDAPLLATCHRRLAEVAVVDGDLAAAEASAARALGLLEGGARRERALTHDVMAMVLSTAGKDGAEAHARLYAELMDELAREFPDDDFYPLHRGLSRQRLAALRFKLGDPEGALEYYEAAAPILEGLAATDPSADVLAQKAAWNRMWIGTCLVLLERLDEGETSLAEAARAYEDLARSDPDNRQYDAWLGNVYDMLGNVARTAGDWELARTRYARALERFTAVAAREPRYAGLPDVLRGKIEECESHLETD